MVVGIIVVVVLVAAGIAGRTMLRRTLVAAAVSATGLLGGLAAVAPSAHAASGPDVCATVNVNINGQGTGGPVTHCLSEVTGQLPAAPTPTLPPPLP